MRRSLNPLLECDTLANFFFSSPPPPMHSSQSQFHRGGFKNLTLNEDEGMFGVMNEKPTDICASAGPGWILPEQVDWRRPTVQRSRRAGGRRPDVERRLRRCHRRLSWYLARAEATLPPPPVIAESQTSWDSDRQNLAETP